MRVPTWGAVINGLLVGHVQLSHLVWAGVPFGLLALLALAFEPGQAKPLSSCGILTAMTTPTQQLQALESALLQLRSDTLTAAAFSRQAQDQIALLTALPPRFPPVLQQLLDRLESSALFSEESCSFSQKDLLDSLQQWLDHAHHQLDRKASP